MSEMQMDVTGEKLTVAEIRARYPDRYVALIDVEPPTSHSIEAGVVFAHAPDRRTLITQTRGLRYCAVVYTGERPRVPFRIWTNVDRAL